MDQFVEQQQVSAAVQSSIAPSTIEVPIPPSPQMRRYFSRVFYGRMNRRNYIIGSLINLIITIVIALPGISFFVAVIGGSAIGGNNLFILVWLIIAFVSFTLAMGFMIFFDLSFTIRRLHDLNQSGWLSLLELIPYINFLFFLYIIFFPGTTVENKYGNLPLPRIDIKHDIFLLA